MNKIILSPYNERIKGNKDFVKKLKLERKEEYINPSIIFRNANISQISEKERDSVKKYRISLILNFFASNVLFNISGDDSYEKVIENMQFNDENISVYDREDILKETNGWFYYLTSPNENCDKRELFPQRREFIPIADNWELFFSYTFDKSDTFSINDIQLKDGIAIYGINNIVYGGRAMINVKSYISHGLVVGDLIKLFNGVEFKIYDIKSVPDKYTFTIDERPFDITGTYFKKNDENKDCSYFMLKNKRIPTNINIDKIAFSRNVYGDLNFNLIADNLNLEGITDFTGREINKIYLSYIKKGKGLFTNVRSGFKLPDNINNNNIKNVNSTNSFHIDLGINNSNFNLGIYEYNPNTDTYTELEPIYHYFNTLNRDLNLEYEGYIYKSSYPIDIKRLTDYTVTSLTNQIGYFDGVYYNYRELLSNTEANIYPFVNGYHYIEKTMILNIQRQKCVSDIIQAECKSFDLSTPIATNVEIC